MTSSPIQRAVERAIKGGWRPKETAKTSLDWSYGQSWQVVTSSFLFWKSLGKAENWGTLSGNSLMDFNTDDNFRHYHHECKGRMWHYQWTRFIDHLAEGKSPDSFFTALLADKS